MNALLAPNPRRSLPSAPAHSFAQGSRSSATQGNNAVAVPVLIWAGRLNGDRFYMSAAWTEVTGLPRQHGLGYSWLRALPAADRGRYLAAHREAVKHGRPYRVQYHLRDASGLYRPMISTGVPCFAEDGSLLSFVGVDVEATGGRPNTVRSGARVESRATDQAEEEEVTDQAGFLASEASEVERQRIRRFAADLRGELTLGAMSIRSNFSRLRRRAERSRVSFALDEVASLLDQADELLRDVARELEDQPSAEETFPTALRWLARRTERKHDVPVTVEVTEPVGSPDGPTGTLLYSVTKRVLREMASWDAERMTLGLTSDGDARIRLSIRATRPTGSIFQREEVDVITRALSSVRRRVESAGGSLAVYHDSPRVVEVTIGCGRGR